jgi:hypothetical protein
MKQKNPQKIPCFCCNICEYKTGNKKDYNKHCLTLKHKNETNETIETNPETPNCPNTYMCHICDKIFKSRTTLWRHRKTCIEESKTDLVIVEPPKPTLDPNMVFDFVKQMTENNEALIKHQIEKEANNTKQSQEFQLQMFNQMMEFMKQQCAITNNNNINNGQIQQNNNQFNLQVYLNETCKNAMTINQFLDYLQPTLQELEDTAHLGYVESISRIIMRGFKNLEEEELPFHCTDLKREHIYVKNPDKEWVKETDDKPLLLRFVKEVTKRNFNNIFAWQKQNPTWSSYSSKKNDLYNSIVENAMSGATEKEQNDNYEKIMKNIMKNITIDKSKKNKK